MKGNKARKWKGVLRGLADSWGLLQQRVEDGRERGLVLGRALLESCSTVNTGPTVFGWRE